MFPVSTVHLSLHTIDFKISQSCLGAVSRSIDGAPKIKSKGMSPIKALCSHTQHGATTTAHVENLFVAPQVKIVQQF